jgi:hypothetical protein
VLKINKTYLVWALCGYLATTLILAVFLETEGMVVAQRFGLFTIALAIPFFLSLFIVTKLFEPEFKSVGTPLRAIRIGICGGALLVILVAIFASIGGFIYSLMGGDVGYSDAGGAVMMLLFTVLGALVWAAIPVITFGAAFGLWIYSDSKNKLKPEEKL